MSTCSLFLYIAIALNTKLHIPKSFVGFLIASTIIWFIINLSKVYQVSYVLPINYSDFAQDKILQKDPIYSLDVQVKASGFHLLTESFKNLEVKIPVRNLKRKSKGNYYLLTKTLLDTVQNQLPKGFLLNYIHQDSIHFDLGELTSKKVPLIPDLSINYKLGFDATRIQIIPDSILVSGSVSQLENIQSIPLEKLSIDELSESLDKKLAVIYPDDKQIKFSHKNANIHIEVAKFTEGRFNVALFVKGIPPKNITVYPKTVTVIFKVQLKDYARVTPESFEVVADYKFTEKNGLTYLLPELQSKSKYVYSVKVVPEKIDYLIYN